VPLTDDYEEIITLDTFCEVYRTNASGVFQKEDTYLARSFERSRDNGYDAYVIGAVSLNDLIRRRLIDPDDDPLGANGFSTKLDPADTVIRAYAREQMADQASAERQIPGLSVPAVVGDRPTVGVREGYSNLLEVFQNITQRGNVDFEVRRTSGASMQLFIGVIGDDLTKTSHYPGGAFVYLTPLRGNLNRPSLNVDRRSEVTVIYARNEGNRGNQTVLKVLSVGTSDSVFGRIEGDMQAQNASDALELLTQAQAELAKRRSKAKFTFSPTGFEPGYIYRKDWDLGDRITVGWGSFEQDLRIVGVDIQLRDNDEQIAIDIVDDKDY